jgi:hypothetical protein
MDIFFKVFLVVLLALAFIGWLADRRAAANRPNVTPGLSFLPGDIKYRQKRTSTLACGGRTKGRSSIPFVRQFFPDSW